MSVVVAVWVIVVAVWVRFSCRGLVAVAGRLLDWRRRVLGRGQV